MNKAEIALNLWEMLAPAVVAFLGWASIRLANWLKAKTKNEYLSGALVRLNDAVFSAVKEVEQTVVGAIRRAKADGKITDEEKAEIKAKAIAAVKSYLGAKGLLELAKVLGLDGAALDALIGAKIEGAVHDMKTATDPT